MIPRSVIIVAGGTGTRMKTEIPKQFMLLAGLPVIMHSVNTFCFFDPSIKIVIVMPTAFFPLWDRLCQAHLFNVKHFVTAGGETRSQSVKNGLGKTGNEGYVAIHDAVRPLVSAETIRKGFEEAVIYGNAIPSLPMKDSVRVIKDTGSKPVSRDQLRIIQTPQVFRVSLIKKAYSLIGREDFTDDATVLERSGELIHLYEGNMENIKITYPPDLKLAESFLRNPETRS